MKILLVYPYFLYDRTHAENVDALPMGMYYLGAALLEAGHEVELADWHQVYTDPSEVERTLARFEPDLVGVSIFHANRWGGLDVAEYIKQTRPDTRVVFGGVGATFLSRLLLEHFSCVDAIIRGEGEQTFLTLVERLEHGDSFADIAGLSYRDHAGSVVENADAPLIQDLDSLPNPAKYYAYQHVALTRGCPGNCRFCGSPRFWGPKVRYHSPEYFVEQLALLRERGVRFFYVSDDTFTARKSVVLEVCRLIRERGLDITWAAISRVDRVDEEILDAMRRAGCIQISYGVESGSEKIRQALNKRQTNEQIDRAFALTTAYGILARAYIIYGCPGADEQSLAEDRAFLDRVGPLVALFYVLQVFPGTALYDEALQRFGLDDSMWLERNEDALYLDLDPAMSAEDVIAYGRKLKEAYHARLPRAALEVNLVEDSSLDESHAAFLARLGLTFLNGDYASLPLNPAPKQIAEAVLRRSLEYADNPVALHGLGLLLATLGKDEDSMSLLQRGAAVFPNDPDLAVAYAVGLIRSGRAAQAETVLERFAHLQSVAPVLQACREQLKQV